MAINPITGPRTPPETRLPLTENLRIYLYQLTDTGAMTREQADALVTGEPLPPEIVAGLQPGQLRFIQDCQARLR